MARKANGRIIREEIYSAWDYSADGTVASLALYRDMETKQWHVCEPEGEMKVYGRYATRAEAMAAVRKELNTYIR